MLASDLKVGTIFKENDEPYKVEKYTHTKTARGGATVKVRARNLVSSSLVDRNYKSTDKVEDADVARKTVQYSYHDANYIFMDPETYNQFYMTPEDLGDSSSYLIEGENVQVLYFEGKPVSIELPNNVILTVTYTEPGNKGNSVTNVYKDATLSNGLEVRVPLFMKIGDTIKVDTRTGEYVSKA